MTTLPERTMIGPKAASLVEMREAGLPVPDAFFIPGSAYRTHLEDNCLLPMIRARTIELADRRPDTAQTAAPEAALSEIRDSIVSAPLDPALARELRERYSRLGGGLVAVRSSATAEDLPGHSFAGQHGTFFGADIGEVLLDVRHCWASLWTDRAFAYRDRRDFDHVAADMAVIGQRLVPADSADAGSETLSSEAC